MAIFASPAYPDRKGITESFAPEAKGMLALMNLGEAAARDSDNAIGEQVGKTDHFNLNPPDDSPAAKLKEIIRLIAKGEPAKALERADKLLNGPELDGELKLKLRDTVEAGLHDLTIAGQANLANEFRLKLAPSLELAPTPAPQFKPRQPAPGMTMGMVA